MEGIMEQMSSRQMKTFDWHLFWTAAAVVVTLGSLIFGCFRSLSNDIQSVRERLVVIETTLILKGIMPKELAANSDK
jgi:hypothetical protein